MLMKKPLIFVMIFVALVFGGVVFVLTNQQADEQPELQTSQEPNKSSTTSKDKEPTGQYTEYSEESLANAKGQAVIFFHAPWCPQCRELESTIESEGVPDGFTILKADYDSSTDLRQKYGVTIQTTLVKVDQNGDSIEKFVAYDEPNISAVTEDFLKK